MNDSGIPLGTMKSQDVKSHNFDDQASHSIDTPYVNSSSDTRWGRFKDTFRQQEIIEGEKAILQKGISRRHLTLMALVTGVGTGLLVGSGKVLSDAGPLFLIVGYAIVGSFLYPTLQAAGEMAVNYAHLPGGYNNYPRRFIDESLCFAITWNYCIQWLSVIAIELVTATITIAYWNDTINPDVWVVIFWVFIVFVNFNGSKGYGEGEFILGSCKLLMIVGFIIMTIVVNLGGGPVPFIGGKYWRDPGYYTNFKGLCSVFVTGAFSLGQSEFVALSAAEQVNPRKAIPSACKLIFWRIVILFLGSLTMVGLMVPYTSDRLLGGGGSNASPYVLAAALHNVRAIPSIINATILLSVTSVGSSALYSSARTLHSLSMQGFAPKQFNYVDRAGRPLYALIVCSIIGLFSFIAAYKKQDEVFSWLLAISGLSQIFTWGGICISHVRFRMALKYRQIPLESLGYVASTGVWGSYYAILWFALVLIAQFWIALYPIRHDALDASYFFQSYLAAVVLIIFWVGHKLWTRNWRLWIKIEDIDVDTDRVMFDQELLNLERQEDAERFKQKNFFMKAIQVMFC